MVLWSFYSCWVSQGGSREVSDGGQLPCCHQLEINSLCFSLLGSLCYFHTCLAVLGILTTIFSCFLTCHVVWYFSIDGFFLPISTVKNLLSTWTQQCPFASPFPLPHSPLLTWPHGNKLPPFICSLHSSQKDVSRMRVCSPHCRSTTSRPAPTSTPLAVYSGDNC